MNDPTLNGTKDPALRLRKLVDRLQIIEEQIAELKERHYLIECEIAQAGRTT